jgi:hypothetical protein
MVQGREAKTAVSIIAAPQSTIDEAQTRRKEVKNGNQAAKSSTLPGYSSLHEGGGTVEATGIHVYAAAFLIWVPSIRIPFSQLFWQFF